jgi:hypothetical protein
MAKQDFFKGFDTSIPINWGNGIVEPLQAAIDRTTAFRQAARGNSNRATRLKNASPMLDRVKFRSRSLDDLFSLYMPFSTIVDTDKGNVAIDPSTTIPEGVRSYFNSFYYDFNNSGIMGDIIDGVKRQICLQCLPICK